MIKETKIETDLPRWEVLKTFRSIELNKSKVEFIVEKFSGKYW